MLDNVSLPDTEESSKHRIACPRLPRKNETIGGGFIVVERTRKKRRLRPAAWPHEVASFDEAEKAIERLQKLNPDKSYVIMAEIAFRKAVV